MYTFTVTNGILLVETLWYNGLTKGFINASTSECPGFESRGDEIMQINRKNA